MDEEIRDWWSAKTGDKGEWIAVDLQEKPTINAIQINFADVDTKTLGRPTVQKGYQYLIESSDDKQTWKTVIDKSTSNEDLPHPYFELTKPIKARFIRVMNVNTPDGKFAISGLRVFGRNTNIDCFDIVKEFEVKRDEKDGCVVKLSWDKVAAATGYNIRYGIAKDKLYLNYMVYDKTEATIRSLVKDTHYWFAIDVFGENGVVKSKYKAE